MTVTATSTSLSTAAALCLALARAFVSLAMAADPGGTKSKLEQLASSASAKFASDRARFADLIREANHG
jgi:hypothetical protein